MQAPCFIIIGPPHHGKTELRKIVSEITSLKGESTSEVIYSFLAHRRKVPVADLKAIPKEVLRPELIEAGDFLVGLKESLAAPAIDPEIDQIVYRVPSALIRTLYVSGFNVIDGVRRRQELTDAINHLTWNGVRSVVIWVTRPGAETVADNTELTAADATDIIFNDGTLEDLRAQALAIIEKHFGKQDKLDAPIPTFESAEEAVAAHSAPADLSQQVATARKLAPNEL